MPLPFGNSGGSPARRQQGTAAAPPRAARSPLRRADESSPNRRSAPSATPGSPRDSLRPRSVHAPMPPYPPPFRPSTRRSADPDTPNNTTYASVPDPSSPAPPSATPRFPISPPAHTKPHPP